MLKLIKNGEVYAPNYLGTKDILIANQKIAAIDDNIEITADGKHLEVIDAKNMVVSPGLIDGHVHITGGGGEGSFKTRTPELMLTDCIEGGITTVVGVIGTDGTTRTMTNLVAKAKALNEEGITCFCMSGNYHVPVKTLTGSVENDIMLIQEIIGAGEIAISDHRSSQPTKEELARLISESRIGGILSGKGGTVNIHVGDGASKLELLEELVETTDIPISQVWPTHINRNEELIEAGIIYAKKGGYIDFTTSSLDPDLENSDRKCSKVLKRVLHEGVPIDQITFTSDGQGSLPKFNKDKQFIGLGVGKVSSLFAEVRDAYIKENVPLEKALKVATENPAKVLKLETKGVLEEGKDADILFISKDDFTIHSVMANGKWLMHDSEYVVKGTFE
ncbi:beta-aspartyl-peptidase [Bacillus shivajii]|uniref:beta-aspartyl-peptidase n=1 Tax=Bacillus shivajii TaxID=1983719 RepID=UPI001CF93B0B|nr:beta-aspartyl-peptidase [Bacillus shivajii]UCZ55353.1 beta-aspartyl-peptidase [Bacillus shivajii]